MKLYSTTHSTWLSLLLETTTETKEKAELLATERGEFIEYLYGRIDRSENLRRAEDKR
jgi:hypothetical protein